MLSAPPSESAASSHDCRCCAPSCCCCQMAGRSRGMGRRVVNFLNRVFCLRKKRRRTTQRLSGLSLDRCSQEAIQVRILDDVDKMGGSLYEASLTNDFLTASERLLIQNLDSGSDQDFLLGRFLTLHKRKKKSLTTRSLVNERALLDDVLHGQVQKMLCNIGDWHFNAFILDDVSGGHALPVLCVHLFHKYGLIKEFDMEPVKVWKGFMLIEQGYHSTNPYHNAIHGTDVTQAMHCYLEEEVIRKHLTPLEKVAAIIAAVAHDLDHPGVNQPFLIATSNHLASLYKNASVLENHHWRSAMGCLIESGMLNMLTSGQWKQVQEQIRSLILATDITRQQEFITRFKDYLYGDGLDMNKADHRDFILQIALKCADICNPCRPWEISQKWSKKVCEEFFRQGDYERQLNLPITPCCDRYTSTVPKIQLGFFRFVVYPLFEVWHEWLKTSLSSAMLEYLRSNQTQWEVLALEDEPLLQIDAPRTDNPPQIVSELCADSDDLICLSNEEQADSFSFLSPHTSDPTAGNSNRRHSMPVNLPTSSWSSSSLTSPKLPLAPIGVRSARRMSEVLQTTIYDLYSNKSPSPALDYPQTSSSILFPELSITSMNPSFETSRVCDSITGQFPPAPELRRLTRQQTFPPPPFASSSSHRHRYLSNASEYPFRNKVYHEAIDEVSGSSSNNTSSQQSSRKSSEVVGLVEGEGDVMGECESGKISACLLETENCNISPRSSDFLLNFLPGLAPPGTRSAHNLESNSCFNNAQISNAVKRGCSSPVAVIEKCPELPGRQRSWCYSESDNSFHGITCSVRRPDNQIYPIKQCKLAKTDYKGCSISGNNRDDEKENYVSKKLFWKSVTSKGLTDSENIPLLSAQGSTRLSLRRGSAPVGGTLDESSQGEPTIGRRGSEPSVLRLIQSSVTRDKLVNLNCNGPLVRRGSLPARLRRRIVWYNGLKTTLALAHDSDQVSLVSLTDPENQLVGDRNRTSLNRKPNVSLYQTLLSLDSNDINQNAPQSGDQLLSIQYCRRGSVPSMPSVAEGTKRFV